MKFSDLLNETIAGPLCQETAQAAFNGLFSGDYTPPQIAAFLTAMRTRGEALEEIIAAAASMRTHCLPVKAPEDAMDVVGTGGDGKHTLNVSTAAAFVIAGAGVPVAKHGNKNMSSKSGTADVQSHLGIEVMLPAPAVQEVMNEVGMCFMMAPMHHPAMRHVGPVRAELGVRTVFNILGPLTNPAGARYQLTGCFSPDYLMVMAQTLQALGSKAAWLVHGDDGTDEVSISGATQVVHFNGDSSEISRKTIHPEEFGLPVHPFEAILGGEPSENAKALNAVLQGEPSAYRDAVVLNAAAALLVVGKADDPKTAAEMAAHSLDSGKAQDKCTALARASQTAKARTD